MPRSLGKASEQRGRHARAARTQNRDMDFDHAWSQTHTEPEAGLAEQESDEEGNPQDGSAHAQVEFPYRSATESACCC